MQQNGGIYTKKTKNRKILEKQHKKCNKNVKIIEKNQKNRQKTQKL
tara:strand:- start:178 stop:315 length:138 start_codon:yes stop_codon:yes gene_type:complete